MFAVHCPRHGSRVLLDDRRILAIDNAARGVTVRWVCWCGYVGAHRTGRSHRDAGGSLL